MMGVIPIMGDCASLHLPPGVRFSKAKRHSAVRSFRCPLGRSRSTRIARAWLSLVSLRIRLLDGFVYFELGHATAVFPSQGVQDLRAWVFHVLQVGGIDLGVA